MRKTLEMRFKEKVSEKDSGCHEWTGCVVYNGYGQIHVNGRTEYAHRIAWLLAHGAIPKHLYVLHRCDNRKCVNPKHLFLGTFYDNMDDMVTKVRQAHGEKNGHAKLSAKDVRAIRSSSEKQVDIARRFRVSQSSISTIRSKQTWKYV